MVLSPARLRSCTLGVCSPRAALGASRAGRGTNQEPAAPGEHGIGSAHLKWGRAGAAARGPWGPSGAGSESRREGESSRLAASAAPSPSGEENGAPMGKIHSLRLSRRSARDPRRAAACRAPPCRLAADSSALKGLKRQQPPGDLGSSVGPPWSMEGPVSPWHRWRRAVPVASPSRETLGAPGESPGASWRPCSVPRPLGPRCHASPASHGHGDAAALQPLPGQGLAFAPRSFLQPARSLAQQQEISFVSSSAWIW